MNLNLTKYDFFLVYGLIFIVIFFSILGYFIYSVFIGIGILTMLLVAIIVYLQIQRSKEKLLILKLETLAKENIYNQNKQLTNLLYQLKKMNLEKGGDSKINIKQKDSKPILKNPMDSIFQEFKKVIRKKGGNPRSYPIIISSTQHPHNGGAATNAYKLVSYFRNNGFKAVGIFFTQENYIVDILDPDNIGGIWNLPYITKNNFFKRDIQNQVRDIHSFFSKNKKQPIIFAKNNAAPYYSKLLFPNSEINYLVSGCWHLDKLVIEGHNISARRFLKSNLPVAQNWTEIKTLALCSNIIPNSKQSKKLIKKIYPEFRSKIIDPINTSSIIEIKKGGERALSWDERDIDILFASSNMNRKIKNAPLAQQIMSHPDFIHLRKVVFGENADDFEQIPNTKVYNRSPQDDVIACMNRTKVVLCTSFFDANPNIISEAIHMGCNVLVSKNVGQSERYPKEWVCKDVYVLDEWIKKVKLLSVTPSEKLRSQIKVSNDINLISLI